MAKLKSLPGGEDPGTFADPRILEGVIPLYVEIFHHKAVRKTLAGRQGHKGRGIRSSKSGVADFKKGTGKFWGPPSVAQYRRIVLGPTGVGRFVADYFTAFSFLSVRSEISSGEPSAEMETSSLRCL